MASLETLDVPQALQAIIDRHQRRLLSLAATLLSGGLVETVVEQTVKNAFG